MSDIEKGFVYLYDAGKETGIQCKGCGSIFLVSADSVSKDPQTGYYSVLHEITCKQCGKKLAEGKAFLSLRQLDNIDATMREAEKKKKAEEEKREAQERERLRREKAAQEAAARTKKAIKDAGGTWEYKVVSLVDGDSGAITPWELEREMNALGRDGWHLRCAYTNELGHNSNSTGIYGLSSGTNATIDQNILIFERFVALAD